MEPITVYTATTTTDIHARIGKNWNRRRIIPAGTTVTACQPQYHYHCTWTDTFGQTWTGFATPEQIELGEPIGTTTTW